MKHTHHLRSAPIAIAAMLALGASPGMAQTAPVDAPTPTDPIVLQLPVGPPAATATPAPEATTVSKPVVQPVPSPTLSLDLPAQAEAEEPAAAATQSSQRTSAAEPAETRAPETSSAPATMTANSANDSPATTASEVAETPLMPPVAAPMSEPLPAAGATAADAEAAVQPNWVALIALALAGVIPLALAFLAFAWFRRRSRRVGTVEAVALETEPESDPVAEPIAESEAVVPAPVAREPVRVSPLNSYRGLPTSGASVALPTEIPETFEERDALLKQMVAAKPDRANPFRSAKARARRARLILQSLGRNFENARPRFDLSQYAANWPALAGNRTAYA